MKRILIVSTVPSTIKRFLVPLAGYLHQNGWEVDGAAADLCDATGSFGAIRERYSVPWSRSLDPKSQVAGGRALLRILERKRYDVVHLNTPIAAFVGRMAMSTLRERPAIVYTAHGFHFHRFGRWYSNWAYLAAERMCGRFTDRLVVMNEEDYSAAQRFSLVPRDRLTWIPGIGIDVERFCGSGHCSGERVTLREEIGALEDEPVFLTIGELNPGKRQIDAISALAFGLPGRGRLAVVGAGPLLESLRRHADRLGLARRVHFLGYRSDILRLLTQATALVMPSEREGLPRSVMEAMAAGCPVIGADVRGTRDLLGGGAGILFPVRDAVSLGRAMKELVDRPDKARLVASIAKQKVVTFGDRVVYPMYLSLFEELRPASV